MKGHGRYLGVNNFCAECGSILLSSGQEQEKSDAAQEKQEGKQGQWQQGSSFKEVLEQVIRSVDTDYCPQTMRRAYIAMKHGNWES